MFAAEPPHTQYDLHFSIFGIPVRVHPLFFLLPVLWGADSGGDGSNRIFTVLIFVAVFLVSILVHELGHSLAMLSMGQRSRIVLYLMGGVAIPDDARGFGRRTRLSTRDEILIYAAGPAAGFLLALLLIGIVKLLGGQIQFATFSGFIPFVFPVFAESSIESNAYLQLLLWIGITINVYLNLFNLLPVIPLDGGQILREIWVELDPWNGMRRVLWASIAVGAVIAVFGLSNHQTFMGIFFAYLAINNFQTLQMVGPGGPPGSRRGPW